MSRLDLSSEPAPRGTDKSPGAFRTISEVAEDLDLPQHVLRFWETRFLQIKPLKRGGGRRYYRPDDVDLLKGIRHLLYGEGYTIKGVQRILKVEGVRFVQSVGRGEQSVAAPPPQSGPDADDDIAAELEDLDDRDGDIEPVRVERPAPGNEALAAASHPVPPGLSPSDRERLHAALAELMECERVLNALRATDESATDDDAP